MQSNICSLSRICGTCESMMLALSLHHIKINFSHVHFSEIISLALEVVHTVMEKYDRRNTYQYKLRESKFDELNKLIFKKAYGNLLGVLLTKVDPRLILTFSHFSDPTLHCFIFHDFLLAHTK